MGKTALSIGANTFAFFTRNPRGGNAKAIDPADASALVDFMRDNGFGPLVAHAPYTLNPCSDNPRTREFALSCMTEDLERMEYLPGNDYNFHPGSRLKQDPDAAIAMIVDTLNGAMRQGQTTTVLLETMAGKGSEMGRSFQELRMILEGVDHPDRVGVCLDTCHVHDGGYDIVTHLDGVLEEFDRQVGISRLKALHLNDSKNPCGAHKDRHETIGNGYLGLETFRRVVNHPDLAGLPCILETPNDLEGYAAEIALLRDMAK